MSVFEYLPCQILNGIPASFVTPSETLEEAEMEGRDSVNPIIIADEFDIC